VCSSDLWNLLKLDEGIHNIAIFGAGQHTEWMQSILNASPGPKVKAILDDHPENKCTFWGLKPLKSTDFNHKDIDAILLSSDCFQKEMRKRCRYLYGETIPLIDLYEGLPPGPYSKN